MIRRHAGGLDTHARTRGGVRALAKLVAQPLGRRDGLKKARQQLDFADQDQIMQRPGVRDDNPQATSDAEPVERPRSHLRSAMVVGSNTPCALRKASISSSTQSRGRAATPASLSVQRDRLRGRAPEARAAPYRRRR
jgi:hypothetical protein